MTKKYETKDVNDWNTSDFHAYMSDRHKEIFGINYQPFVNWGAEKGMLGKFIGTSTKKGEVTKTVAKRFIDNNMENYSPSEQYPGISFGFMYSYNKSAIQQAEQEERIIKQYEKSVEDSNDFDKLRRLL